MSLIILVGPPGAGKGTQASNLVKAYKNIHWISMGDLLRDQISKNTFIGKKASSYLSQGKLAPDDLLVDMLFGEIDRNSNYHIILDGYPRNLNQAKTLTQSKYELSFVLHLSVEVKELKKRIAKRLTVEKRNDDSPEKLAVRLQIYEQEMQTVYSYLQNQAKLDFHSIKATGKIDNILQEIKNLLEKISKFKLG